MKQPLNALIVKEGEGKQDAVRLGEGIFMSRGISNSYLITTDEGDLQINTGMYYEASAIKERFSSVSNGPLRVIVFTQGHPDHVGGWSQFDAPGVETIVQENHAEVREYFRNLQPCFSRRSGRLWSQDIANVDRSFQPPEAVQTTIFSDSHLVAIGGRRFEFYSTPGGETTDSHVVWLPEERTVFTGNLTGPLFGHIPNLYTLRGDKIRSARTFIESIDRVIGLGPEVLVTGHGEPIRGNDEIVARLAQIRDATQYIRDRTFEGMNAGVDLWTLMGSISLPPELDIPQGHGKVPWLVRAIWEEYLGWFRYESTTELYDVPVGAIARDLIDLAGGTAPLLERAQAHLESGRPLEALHLLDIVLTESPNDALALSEKRTALGLLLERSGRENFSEVRWLEAEVRETEGLAQ
jgi:alkyl sulfatase BDS1-like metallo-beta-lactamase superfamily hydrolase